MYCPFCKAVETKVIDSRHLSELNSTKRRRKCDRCDRRFTTFEVIEVQMPMIVKNDGRREPYHRPKLLAGIQKACQKRPVAQPKIDQMVDTIEKKLLDLSVHEVTTKDLGKIVMNLLRSLDPVAYVRFASVYREFQDVNEFVKDLTLEEERPSASPNQ